MDDSRLLFILLDFGKYLIHLVIMVKCSPQSQLIRPKQGSSTNGLFLLFASL